MPDGRRGQHASHRRRSSPSMSWPSTARTSPLSRGPSGGARSKASASTARRPSASRAWSLSVAVPVPLRASLDCVGEGQAPPLRMVRPRRLAAAQQSAAARRRPRGRGRHPGRLGDPRPHPRSPARLCAGSSTATAPLPPAEGRACYFRRGSRCGSTTSSARPPAASAKPWHGTCAPHSPADHSGRPQRQRPADIARAKPPRDEVLAKVEAAISEFAPTHVRIDAIGIGWCLLARYAAGFPPPRSSASLSPRKPQFPPAATSPQRGGPG
jgi:hypothetical protein